MAASLVQVLVAAAVAGRCVAQIDPAHAQNLTVYHLNPVSQGALPINMDTGDTLGDLYFYLGQFLLPLECTNATKEGRAKFDCDNPERVDPNLVVTKVDMQIDSRLTVYSACNVCNGTDPFTHKPCDVGSYVCDCFDYDHTGTCDPKRVGTESIKDHFSPHVIAPKCAAALSQTCGAFKAHAGLCAGCVYLHSKKLEEAGCKEYDFYGFCPNKFEYCGPESPDWMCWELNIPRKTGGNWYSTLQNGLCNSTSLTGDCGWKVYATRTIQNKCLKERMMARVESEDPGCFKGCGPRNTTSSCWIGCFFDTLLGPKARNSDQEPLEGLPITEIEKTWNDAFLPEDRGGCSSVDIPSRREIPPQKLLETVVV